MEKHLNSKVILLLTIGKYSEDNCLCLLLKGSASLSVKIMCKKWFPLFTSHAFVYWFSSYVMQQSKLTSWQTYFFSCGNYKRNYSHPSILLFYSLFITTFRDTFQLWYKILTKKGKFWLMLFWAFGASAIVEILKEWLLLNVFLLSLFYYLNWERSHYSF